MLCRRGVDRSDGGAGESSFSVLERVWARPTFDVHGISGGFTGTGAKTVISAKAVAKVSVRLVPKQDPDKIIAGFRKLVEKNTPKGIRAEVRVLSSGPAVMVNPDHPAIQVAAKAFSDILGKPTVFIRSAAPSRLSATSPSILEYRRS